MPSRGPCSRPVAVTAEARGLLARTNIKSPASSTPAAFTCCQQPLCGSSAHASWRTPHSRWGPVRPPLQGGPPATAVHDSTGPPLAPPGHSPVRVGSCGVTALPGKCWKGALTDKMEGAGTAWVLRCLKDRGRRPGPPCCAGPLSKSLQAAERKVKPKSQTAAAGATPAPWESLSRPQPGAANVNTENGLRGPGCSSVTELLPGMREALGSIPKTTKE